MSLFDKIKKSKKKVVPTKDAPVKATPKTDSPKAAATKKNVEKKETKPATKNTTTDAKKASNAYRVLIRPFVSEKATDAERTGRYTFVVHRDANKTEIKHAIEAVYGVRPKQVRTMQMDGKEVRFGTRFGRRADWKKAIAVMPKGKTINIHEGV